MVDVELDVVDRNSMPPIWDQAAYGPIFIRENVTVGTVVTSVKARYVVSSDLVKTAIQFSYFVLVFSLFTFLFYFKFLKLPPFPCLNPIKCVSKVIPVLLRIIVLRHP